MPSHQERVSRNYPSKGPSAMLERSPRGTPKAGCPTHPVESVTTRTDAPPPEPVHPLKQTFSPPLRAATPHVQAVDAALDQTCHGGLEPRRLSHLESALCLIREAAKDPSIISTTLVPEQSKALLAWIERPAWVADRAERWRRLSEEWCTEAAAWQATTRRPRRNIEVAKARGALYRDLADELEAAARQWDPTRHGMVP